MYGALKALDEFVKKSPDGKFLVGGELTIADIAAGAMLGMMDMVETQFKLIEWRGKYPALESYWGKLEKRESFQGTRPVMFDLKEKVV